ncbi:MAG: hypothetical protein M3Q60_18985 [Actinomycetota bacterium]|nr:hypothetical protein [Actinomycetota bacterium]
MSAAKGAACWDYHNPVISRMDTVNASVTVEDAELSLEPWAVTVTRSHTPTRGGSSRAR